LSNVINVELGLGQSPWFKVVTGRVVEESKRTETSVQHRASAETNAYGSSSTSSATTFHDRTHSVWIVQNDGKEMEVELPSHDFSVRSGHSVSIAWAGKDGSQRGPAVAAVNHATGATWTIDDAGLKPVVSVDSSLWSQVFVVSLAVAVLVGLVGGAPMGLGMMMGPAEIIGLFCVVAAKLPAEQKQHRVVSLAVVQLCAAMREDEGRLSADVVAQRLSASSAAS
jgi:hypothetical protein